MDILTEKEYKPYQKMSRYQESPIYWHSLDNRYMQGFGSNLSQNCTYKLHKISHAETLDDLALYYYGNPIYYWIIADFNQMQNPFEELVVNEYIKIPTFSDIQFDN